MPPGPLLVGADLGSQSAKVVVHTADGRVVASGRRALRTPSTPLPGVVEHPDDDLVDALAAACREAVAALEAAGGRTGQLAGLGLCGIRFTRALLRADGSLAAPVISWMDDRASRAHEPASAPADVAVVTASSGHLTRWLTGRSADSAAAYLGPWPVDLERWDWCDDEELAAYGLRRNQLVELVPPGTVLGGVTAAAAHITGLPAGLPVVATANDKAVEALGCGLTGPTDALVSLGTYVAPMLLGAAPLDPATAQAGGAWTNLAAVPGRYLHEGTGVRRGMWTVTWLRDLVGPGLAGLSAAVEDMENALNAAAADVPVGSDGLLVVLDWLAPADEPWRRGAFVGLDVRHGAAHLYRAVLEGLALTVGGHLRTLADGLDRDVRQVLLSGGGARSPLMRQVVADVTGLPVRAAVDDGSPAALGAAICAAFGTSVHPDFDTAVATMVRPGATVRPEAAASRAYADLARVHADLRAALVPVLRAR